MAINRSYVIVEDFETDENGEPTIKAKIREEMIQKLAAEWNNISNKIEERSFMSEHECMDEGDYVAGLCDSYVDNAVENAYINNDNLSDDEIKSIREQAEDTFYKEYKDKQNEIYIRRNVVEEILSELGARMARPYEHWNEDERYMEYMENRYENDERERW